MSNPDFMDDGIVSEPVEANEPVAIIEEENPVAGDMPLEEPRQEEVKEDNETVKSLKKGASAIGGFFKKGWGAVKSGANKANEKFKETEFGKKTVAEVDKFKQTEFAQKVSEGAKKTGSAIKEGAKKTGAVIKEGATKVKESEFAEKVKEGAKKTGNAIKESAIMVKEKSAPALKKAGENLSKLGKDIKASMEGAPEESTVVVNSSPAKEEP